MTAARGLKTGDLVTVPASYRIPGAGRRTAVVESVSLGGQSFTDTTGARHRTADAELVPLSEDPAPRRLTPRTPSTGRTRT